MVAASPNAALALCCSTVNLFALALTLYRPPLASKSSASKAWPPKANFTLSKKLG
jgi:hypothetical protein